MSTNYRLMVEVEVKEFKKSVANCPGLSIHKEEPENICVTDGTSYLHFSVNGGMVYGCDRYGNNYNAQEDILDPITDDLDVAYLSEHDEGYFEDEDDYQGEEE